MERSLKSSIRRTLRNDVWAPVSSSSRTWSLVSRELARWVIIAAPIGVISGLGAVAFYYLWLYSTYFFLGNIVGVSYPLPGVSTVSWSSSFPRILLLPLVMGLAGLAVGLIVQYLSPEVAGHGTDDAIYAFHRKEGKIRARVPILKAIASALTLGSGGSGGREGPTCQIGSGFGSWWADQLHVSSRERRVALATGLGAGLAAIFRAPLGGAIYAAEIFYIGDFEPEVFVPGIIASVISYSIFGSFFGFGSLFVSPAGLGWSVTQLPLYALLGVVCAAMGVGFTHFFHRIQPWFSSWSMPPAPRIAIGGVLAGSWVLGVYFLLPSYGHFAALSSLNVGYGFVQAIMLGQVGFATFTLLALVTIAVAVVSRMIATGFTVGSGGAAGLFGTSVVIGALLGAGIGGFFHRFSPSVVPLVDVSAFVIVGMMAFFGGISKAPLAVLVMVVEMAQSYSLLLPAMLAIFLAYVLTGKTHLYTEQVGTRVSSPAHQDEYRQAILGRTPLSALTRSNMDVLDPGMSVEGALEKAATSEQNYFPISQAEYWMGTLRVQDLLRVPQERRSSMTVGEIVRPFEVTLDGDTPAITALDILDRSGADVVAVMNTGSPVRIEGLVTRRDLLAVTLPTSGAPSE